MITTYYRADTARVLSQTVLQGFTPPSTLPIYANDWILGRALHGLDDVEFAPESWLTGLDYGEDVALLASGFDD
nr:unnamed protein product [Spirometra erinaceieuropaei]